MQEGVVHKMSQYSAVDDDVVLKGAERAWSVRIARCTPEVHGVAVFSRFTLQCKKQASLFIFVLPSTARIKAA